MYICNYFIFFYKIEEKGRRKKRAIKSKRRSQLGTSMLISSGRQKRKVDPCAEYRTDDENPLLGESLMNIEDTEDSASTTSSSPEPIINSTENSNNDDLYTTTMAPDVKEAVNPFSNSLGEVDSTPIQANSTIWDDTAPDPPAVISDDGGGSQLSVNASSSSKKKREFVSEFDDSSDAVVQNREMISELLEVSKDEMNEGSNNMDVTKANKTDSDPKDLYNLDVPYIGVGDCDFVPLNFTSPLPTEKLQLIKFFTSVLRAQCFPDIVNKTLQLFDDKLVTFDSVNIVLNRKNSFL